MTKRKLGYLKNLSFRSKNYFLFDLFLCCCCCWGIIALEFESNSTESNDLNSFVFFLLINETNLDHKRYYRQFNT